MTGYKSIEISWLQRLALFVLVMPQLLTKQVSTAGVISKDSVLE